MDIPEQEDRAGQAQEGLAVPGAVQPDEGSPEVVVLRGQAADRQGRVQPALEGRPELLRHPQIPRGVTQPHLLLLAGRRQSLQPVLADGFEHGEAWLAVRLLLLDQQAAVRRGGEAVQRRRPGAVPLTRDGLRRLHGPAASEDRQPAEERLLVRREQVVAPGDGLSHRPQALRVVAVAAREQGQAMLQPREHRLGREHLRPGGRQLDRQGKPVQPGADLRHRGSADLPEREVGSDGAGALGEQGHRRVPGQLGDWRQAVRVGHGERRHRELVLPRDTKGHAAGHQHLDLWAGREQIGHGRGGRNHVLEVVQDQQDAPRLQNARQALQERPVTRLGDLERPGDGRQDQGRVGGRGKRDEAHPVGEGVGDVRRDLEGEAGLADPARTSQSQEADVRPTEQAADLLDLLLPPHEAGEGTR